MKSHERLQNFLKREYMKKGGACTLDIAIRDCLTDLFHVSQTTGTDMHQRLLDAEGVWKEEVSIGLDSSNSLG